ncbi:transcriptional regulator [Ramlibacter henchirensis]|uniref:Transcriptional regulator n=1 Tax=Ramlibacter henchirensis TaxID=204072 RepID=A0A4Z0C324_9BURK|nr:AAA family ATPase [Ramlibacter henchirensis]TFZ05966.1 transcriptional regulator [Ramlibacter henchirensis]
MEAARPLLAKFEAFVLDEANARLSRAGVPLELTPRAFDVLCALARREGRLVPKDALLDEVWGHQHVSESVLKTTISQLRAALADDPKSPRYIETAPRRGYRFIAPLSPTAVEVRAPAEPAPAPLAAQAPPDPEMLLIARDQELAELARLLASAAQGRCRVAFVAGEPGIGKSSLLAAFLAAQPVDHAVGQCIEHYGPGEPYLPVLEALNALCRGARGGELQALLRQVAPTWLVQLPWYLTDADRQQLQREVAGATQQRMLRELGELLDRYAARTPLVLVLEDLHWADDATVQLIAYVARRRAPARLFLLGSFRPAELVASDHPLKGLRQELRLHDHCTELDLEAFSEADVAHYLAGCTGGHAFDEAFVRQVQHHTDGLPLFVANLVTALMADGVLRRDCDGRWEVTALPQLQVPQNIAGVIEKQMDRLPADLRHWLAAASVGGVEFQDVALAGVLGTDPARVREGLEELTRQRHWLRATGVVPLADGRTAAHFAFRHALYRHVFYQSLGEARRAELHRRHADVLEQLLGAGAPAVAGELAMHCEQGRAPAAAIRWLLVAAGRSLGRFAPSEALQSARHALSLLPQLPPGEQTLSLELDLRVLEGVSLAQLTVIAGPETAAAFERARELSDRLPLGPSHARALRGLWWVTFARGDLGGARTLATRLMDIAESSGDTSLRVAGRTGLGMTLAHAGEVVQARKLLEEALRLYEDAATRLAPDLFVHDPGVEGMCYLAVLCWWMGEQGQARRHIARALEAAQASRHPATIAISLHIGSVLHSMAREYPLVLEDSESISRLVDTHWLAGGPSAQGWIFGRALVGLGRAEEGLEHMRQAARRCEESGLRVGLVGFHQTYADACISLGRPEEALAAVDRGLALMEDRGERCVLSPLSRMKGQLLLERADPQAARWLDQAVDAARERGALNHEMDALIAWGRQPSLTPRQLRQAYESALARCGPEPTPAAAELRRALGSLD